MSGNPCEAWLDAAMLLPAACGVCAFPQHVNEDGTVRLHGGKPPCAGSDQPPGIVITVVMAPAAAVQLAALADPDLPGQVAAADVISRLADTAALGVRTSGGWQRDWLYRVFGEAWTVRPPAVTAPEAGREPG